MRHDDCSDAPPTMLCARAIEALTRLASATDPMQAAAAVVRARAVLGEEKSSYDDLIEVLARRACEVAMLRRLAGTDPLTGVANRRTFLDALEREAARCRRTDEGLAVILLDLDDLERINDSLGHPAGDRPLYVEKRRRKADVCRTAA